MDVDDWSVVVVVDRIVMCNTLRRAFYEVNELAHKYPDLWIEKNRKPLSLTSIFGVRYIFHSETEVYALRGSRSDIISIADVYEDIGGEL